MKIKGKEIPQILRYYYIFALFHVCLLLYIKFKGWSTLTNFLFFAAMFITIGAAAYILHMYFKKDTDEMSDEELKLKEDYGQIWVILVHLLCVVGFLLL